MAKKKNTEKEIINDLKEKLVQTPDTIEVVEKETVDTKQSENNDVVNNILEDVKELKENKIEKILSDIKDNNINEDNVDEIEKQITDAIKEGENLKNKIEEVVKAETKIRSSFTNYWNGTYFS